MRKFTGWLIIVLCSILLLMFVIVLITMIPGLSKSNSNVHMSASEIISSVFGFGLVILLLVFGLRNGIKRVKNDNAIDIVDYTEKLSISLTGQIAYKDYRNLILGMSYKKPIYLVLLGVLFLFTLTFLTSKGNAQNHLDSNYFIFIILGFVTLSPIFTLYQIKKIYKSSKIFYEHIDYFLTNESIQIKGETVDSIQKWTHFFKIKETKNFFMLYHGEMVAILLDKKMFNISDIEEFRRFTKSLNVIRE